MRRALLVGVLVLTALVGAGVVVADPWQSDETATVNETIEGEELHDGDLSGLNEIDEGVGEPDFTFSYTSPAFDIADADEAELELDISGTDGEIEWQGFNNGEWESLKTDSFEGSDTLDTEEYDLSDHNAEQYRFQIEGQDDSTDLIPYVVEIYGGTVGYDSESPVLSNPDPADGEFITDRSTVDLSIEVDDDRFGGAGDETVEVTFYDAEDDSEIGSDTLVESGTATTDWSGIEMGQNDWYAVAENDDGLQTETDVLLVEAPAELEIRDETEPDELVTTESDVEVTFFDDDTVITRSTDDGVVDLEGLPADRPLVVQVDADGFVTRQSVIPSITEQQNVYLLPDDVEAVDVRFDVDDSTGSFPPEATRVLVEKPITRDGETVYETIAGDDLGAQGMSTTLERDQRYRMVVENTETGQRNVLGPYVATTSETATLQVDSIAFDTEVEDIGYQWGASFDEDPEPRVQFNFAADNRIETLSVTVRDRATGDVVLDETITDTEQVGEIADVAEFDEPAERTYVVEWEATVIDEDGNAFDVSGSQTVGSDQLPVGIPGVGDDVLQVVSVLLLFLVGGLFSQANAEVGGVVVSLTAAGFWFIGMLPGAVSGLFIAAALLLSVLWMVRNARGEQ